MKTKQQKFQLRRGYSLIGLLVVSALMGVLLAGNINTLAFIHASLVNSSNEELLNQASRLSEVLSSKIQRGGSALTTESDAFGVQVCDVSSDKRNCVAYTSDAAQPCMALPIQIGSGALATIEVQGFRLVDNTLQQRVQQNVNMRTFNTERFCTASAEWRNMHDPKDIGVSQFKLCKFQAEHSSQIFADYGSNCPSILTTAPDLSTFWIAQVSAFKTQQRQAQISQHRIVQLFNSPRVGTPKASHFK